MHKHEKLVGFIISVLAVAAFVVTTFYALVWASGIKYNPATGTIEQTSVISIQPTLSNVTVLMNGQQIATQTPIDERDLEPGRYEILISKPGYLTLDKTFQLAADQVGIISPTIELLAQNPTVEKNVSGLTYHAQDPFDVNIGVTQGEILDGISLVTRLSSNPTQVHRFNNGFIYQLNDQIRFYLPETSQDVLVYQLSSSSLANLSIDESNWQVSIFTAAATADVVHLIEPNAVSAGSH